MSSLLQRTYLTFFIIFLITIILLIIKTSKQNSLANNFPTTTISTTTTRTEIIDWNTTIQLISECKIKSIFQKRNLTVTLRTYDNQIFQTTENQIDDIFKLAKKYQGPCGLIQQITE